MDGARVYINRSYFRRATGLSLWSIDSNYCQVRVTIKMKRKLAATLCIAAEFSAANTSETVITVITGNNRKANNSKRIFKSPVGDFNHSRHQSLRRLIPLSTLRDAVLSSREFYRARVYCVTLRQANPLSGSSVNLYHEERMEIDKLFSCLAAVRRPLCSFLDLFENQHQQHQPQSRSQALAISNNWIVRLLNNLTVQSLGLCADYLYVLHVGTDVFELQDVNQASIISCRISSVASYGCLNGWFFLQYAGGGCQVNRGGEGDFSGPDVESLFGGGVGGGSGAGCGGGYLALQCGRTGQLRDLFNQLLGGRCGGRVGRRWPSAPCLRCGGAEEATGGTFYESKKIPKRESSFNTHRPRSQIPASPRKISSSGASFGQRFSFFRRQLQQPKPEQSRQQSPQPARNLSISSFASGGSSNAGSGCSSSTSSSSLSSTSVASLSQLDVKPWRRRSLTSTIRRTSFRSFRHRREKLPVMLDA